MYIQLQPVYYWLDQFELERLELYLQKFTTLCKSSVLRDTLRSCHCHLLCSDICQRFSKARSAKLGSPVSVVHCSVVFAKDYLKLMAIIFG